jgi:hypothetical protein
MRMNPRGVYACVGRGHALPESRSSVLAPARKRHNATRRGRGQVPAQKKRVIRKWAVLVSAYGQLRCQK